MVAGVWGVAPRAGEAIAAELIRRRQKIDQDELEFSCLAAQFAATDEYDEQGFDSPISWLKAVCRMSGGAAADRVCVGDQVERLGQSSAALAAGEIGFAHLALIARTSAALSERLDEARLLSHARKLNIFPFRNTCLHARHAGDPEGFVNEETEGVEARSLTLTTSDEGVVLVQGLLDKVGGAAWRMRSSTSRCTRSTSAWCRSGRICRSRVPWKRSWVYLKRRRRRWSSRSRSHPRLSSGCSVTRILLDSESMVIDVGRAKRVVSAPQSKALKIRDRGCVWPGCDRPATWTSAHNVVHWIHGGKTDLPNLVLLCYRHHCMVHEGNWQLVRSDDGCVHTIPPGLPTTWGGPAQRGRGDPLSNVRSP